MVLCSARPQALKNLRMSCFGSPGLLGTFLAFLFLPELGPASAFSSFFSRRWTGLLGSGSTGHPVRQYLLTPPLAYLLAYLELGEHLLDRIAPATSNRPAARPTKAPEDALDGLVITRQLRKVSGERRTRLTLMPKACAHASLVTPLVVMPEVTCLGVGATPCTLARWCRLFHRKSVTTRPGTVADTVEVSF